MTNLTNNATTLSVSLISHNGRKDLARLLPSLTEALTGLSSETLLVDNCSTDGTLTFIKERYPSIQVIQNQERAGYGANHNKNLARARGRYFCLMNADMTLSSDIFRSLIAFMEAHPEVGIVAPSVKNEDGTPQYLNKRYPSVADLFVRRFVPDPFKHLFEKRLVRYEMRDVGYDAIMDVPFLSGAFMLTRGDALKGISGFDERFFLYFEDVDLCRRMQKMSYRTVYYPYSHVVHRWERAAHKELKWALVFMASAFKYFNKWGYQLF